MHAALYILPFILTIIYGLADAAKTIRYDDVKNSIFELYKPKDWVWLMSSNSVFDPAYVWTCNFWHFMKFVEIYMMVGISFTTCAAGLVLKLTWYYYLPYLLIANLEGVVFGFFYLYFFRIESARQSLWTVTKHLLFFGKIPR